MWDKRTKANPLRGFTDDGDSVAATRHLTAQQKVTFLELMLGQIANYCPVISRNTIVRCSTSIDSVWHTIRQHYGFQVTGAHFLDFADIRLEPNERSQKLHLAGFFSAKLRGTQSTWLPCEVEALSIAVATRHFSPFLIQSQHKACILTDSKPCVQAYEKLCRGEFSTSPRVSTFLSTVSRYQASVTHVAGSAILPSDFASRNAPACEDQSCQVCSFVQHLEESVVQRVPIQDVLNGREKLPFTSRPAWLSIQSECADLRRTHAHLKQGTRQPRPQGAFPWLWG